MASIMSKMQCLSAKHPIITSPETKICYSNDVIIVGAGVAGSALAYALGKHGRRVQIIEKNLKMPDTFAGEYLLPKGDFMLSELGLADCVENIEHVQHVLGFFKTDEHGNITKHNFSSKKDDETGESVGRTGRSFRHGHFIKNLRNMANSLDNVNLEEGTVTSLIEVDGAIKGINYKARESGEEISTYAPLTVVCDGRRPSKLQKFLAETEQKEKNPPIVTGLVVKNCKLPEPNYAYDVHVKGNPRFVMYPISSNEIRFIIECPQIKPSERAGFFIDKVAPQVPCEKLRSAFISTCENDPAQMNKSIMTNNIRQVIPHKIPGALLLGDTLDVRDVFDASGMTVVLQDVASLCKLFETLDLKDATKVMEYVTRFYNERKKVEDKKDEDHVDDSHPSSESQT